ncbi:hypothetical protein AAFN85_04350 [Mucilaginibacter sp. CAU 1740]|uniref:hypothetical protein n=1 Tax=Mucilaginibacter sp. CAU 1740 TaxID=3140365 RepID=UPI00325B0935
MKQILNLITIFFIAAIALSACSKKSSDTVKPTDNTGSVFYHGNIMGSPNTIVGPGNAILLRSNGTMREYANDYYSLGTSMAGKDTASAKIKLEGTYITKTDKNGLTTITATWRQTNGSPVLTYTLIGEQGNTTLNGTLTSAGTGIGTVAEFQFTKTP